MKLTRNILKCVFGILSLVFLFSSQVLHIEMLVDFVVHCKESTLFSKTKESTHTHFIGTESKITCLLFVPAIPFVQLLLVEMFCAYLALTTNHMFLEDTDTEKICVSVWHKAQTKMNYIEQEEFISEVE